LQTLRGKHAYSLSRETQVACPSGSLKPTSLQKGARGPMTLLDAMNSAETSGAMAKRRSADSVSRVGHTPPEALHNDGHRADPSPGPT